MDPWNRSSSGESINNQTISDLVKNASDKLQQAITDLENSDNDDGVTSMNPTTPASTSAAVTTSSLPYKDDDEYDDPDDLAAAFFARQAMKNEADNKLRIEEWAQTIVAFRNASSSSSTDNVISTREKEQEEGTQNDSKSVDRQSLADSLFNSFQKEFNA